MLQNEMDSLTLVKKLTIINIDLPIIRLIYFYAAVQFSELFFQKMKIVIEELKFQRNYILQFFVRGCSENIFKCEPFFTYIFFYISCDVIYDMTPQLIASMITNNIKRSVEYSFKTPQCHRPQYESS